MISIPSSGSFASVFTAEFPGIYVFVLSSGNAGHEMQVGYIPPGGENINYYDAAPRQNGSFGQQELVVFLDSGWVVRHKGPSGTLYGVRIGDEL